MTPRASLALLTFFALTLGSHASAQTAPTGTRLVVQVSQMRNDRGTLRCMLFASATGFPNQPQRAVARVTASVRGGRSECVFDNITARQYAVAVHHDEDGEGDFDTGLFGIPTEGVGASRDAHGSMGPPSFDDARIDVAAGENRIRIRVAYP